MQTTYEACSMHEMLYCHNLSMSNAVGVWVFVYLCDNVVPCSLTCRVVHEKSIGIVLWMCIYFVFYINIVDIWQETLTFTEYIINQSTSVLFRMVHSLSS